MLATECPFLNTLSQDDRENQILTECYIFACTKELILFTLMQKLIVSTHMIYTGISCVYLCDNYLVLTGLE